MMSSVERGTVVATASKKAAFLASSFEEGWQVVEFNSITGPKRDKPNVWS